MSVEQVSGSAWAECPNGVESAYWLQWAAMKGEVQASERLANLYYSPFESPPDPDGLLFRFWRDLAITQGSSGAKELLDLDGRLSIANEIL
ncbi:hypothetical protein N1E65_31520 [Pseudomonas aeruginosa]|nr:hypothetical protein [Pseudomonas aeruginosa]